MVARVASASSTVIKWAFYVAAPLVFDWAVRRINASEDILKDLDKKNPLLSRIITVFTPSVALLRFVNHSSRKTTFVVSTVLTAFATWKGSSTNGTSRHLGGSGRMPKKLVEKPSIREVKDSYLQRKYTLNAHITRFEDLPTRVLKQTVLRSFFQEIKSDLSANEAPIHIQSLRKCGPLYMRMATGFGQSALRISDGDVNRGGMLISIQENGACSFRIGSGRTQDFSILDSDLDRAIFGAHLDLVMDQIEWIRAALRSNDAIADLMVQSLTRHFDLTCAGPSNNTPFTVGKLYNNVCFPHDMYFEEQVTITADQHEILFFMNESDGGGYAFEIIHMTDGNVQIKKASGKGQKPISYKLHKIANTHYLSIEGSEREDISISQYLETPALSMRDVSGQNQQKVSKDLPLILRLLQTIHALETSAHTLVITEGGRVQYANGGEQVSYTRLRQIAGYTNGAPGNAYLRLEGDKVLLGDQIVDPY